MNNKKYKKGKENDIASAKTNLKLREFEQGLMKSEEDRVTNEIDNPKSTK